MSDKEAIRKYVEERFDSEKKKRRIIMYVINVLLAAIMLIVAWTTGTSNPTAGMSIISVALAITLLMQGIITYLDSTKEGDRQIRRQLVFQARIKRALGGLDSELDEMFDRPKEKLKRDGSVYLSQDGELVSDEDIEAEVPPRRKSGGAS